MIRERAGQPVAIGAIVIEPIERIVVHLEQVGPFVTGVASKEPVAIVVRSETGSWRITLRPGGD